MSDERPGILTAIAIIAITLGAMGVLASLLSVANLVLQAQLPANFPGASEQLEFAERMREATKPYIVPIMIGTAANCVVSVLLIVGGALLLARKPAAVGLMTVSVAAAIVVDLYLTAVTAYAQVKVMPVTQEMARATAANMPAGADAAMDSIMSAAVWAGTAVTALWLLCKLAYYIVALVALKRPSVKGWVIEGAAA